VSFSAPTFALPGNFFTTYNLPEPAVLFAGGPRKPTPDRFVAVDPSAAPERCHLLPSPTVPPPRPLPPSARRHHLPATDCRLGLAATPTAGHRRIGLSLKVTERGGRTPYPEQRRPRGPFRPAGGPIGSAHAIPGAGLTGSPGAHTKTSGRVFCRAGAAGQGRIAKTGHTIWKDTKPACGAIPSPGARTSSEKPFRRGTTRAGDGARG
jgi:hypothetical protein